MCGLHLKAKPTPTDATATARWSTRDDLPIRPQPLSSVTFACGIKSETSRFRGTGWYVSEEAHTVGHESPARNGEAPRSSDRPYIREIAVNAHRRSGFLGTTMRTTMLSYCRREGSGLRHQGDEIKHRVEERVRVRYAKRSAISRPKVSSRFTASRAS